MREFHVQTYSKQQLACLYFPDAAPRTAVNHLVAWITKCKQLSEALTQTGYQKTDKLLTPKQVALIAHYLGEP